MLYAKWYYVIALTQELTLGTSPPTYYSGALYNVRGTCFVVVIRLGGSTLLNSYCVGIWLVTGLRDAS